MLIVLLKLFLVTHLLIEQIQIYIDRAMQNLDLFLDNLMAYCRFYSSVCCTPCLPFWL